jgi:hypothetical protein
MLGEGQSNVSSTSFFLFCLFKGLLFFEFLQILLDCVANGAFALEGRVLVKFGVLDMHMSGEKAVLQALIGAVAEIGVHLQHLSQQIQS